MSPFTCDSVFFTVLAAGLRPVMAPLSRADGNIEPTAVTNSTWASVDGVLTTNLYGLPDRVHQLRACCQHLGIPLIEDAAQALETNVDGQPVGTFGTAAAFSLSKHVAAMGGGVLAFADAACRPQLEQLLAEVMKPRTVRRDVTDVLYPTAEQVARTLHLVRPAHWFARSLRLIERAGGNRMPLSEPALRKAVAQAPDLARFEPWVGLDLAGYRTLQPPHQLKRTLSRLRRIEHDRARRLEGVLRLRELPGVAPAVQRGEALPLLRVPLLIEDRDVVQVELRRRLIATIHLFDPPLDDYAGPEFVEPSSNREASRWWARHVLPVDPLNAERVLFALSAMNVPLKPARNQHNLCHA